MSLLATVCMAMVPTPRIAALDDDPEFLQLLELLVREAGWDFFALRDSHAVVEVLAQEQPDVLVLDVRLAGYRSGWQVLQELQADGRTRDMAVIVCSAAVDDLREKAEWLRSHGFGVLSKPFDIEDLYTLVESLLADAVVAYGVREGGSE